MMTAETSSLFSLFVVLLLLANVSRNNAFVAPSLHGKAVTTTTTSTTNSNNNIKSPSRRPCEDTALFCGLIAVVSNVWDESSAKSSTNKADHELFHEDVLHRTTAMLDHRGPDGMTVHTDVGQNWGMGHTRLAIVDPENRKADMPFRLDFGKQDGHIIHLVANGEIYNHQALYEEMVQDQENPWTHERYSGSDCEVIAHAYAKYGGPDMVQKLDGMFAFCLLQEDKETGEITDAFAARDPVGIKPLYVGVKQGTYVFASELKALVGHVDPS